jgi:hypothetical protein
LEREEIELGWTPIELEGAHILLGWAQIELEGTQIELGWTQIELEGAQIDIVVTVTSAVAWQFRGKSLATYLQKQVDLGISVLSHVLSTRNNGSKIQIRTWKRNLRSLAR